MTRDPSQFERDALQYLLSPAPAASPALPESPESPEPEDERTRFETRLLEEDGLVEELSAIEDELIDRYVRGELAAEELARFEQNLRPRPGREQKIAFARSLAHAADRSARTIALAPARRGARRWASPLAAAAAVAACALFALWLLHGSHSHQPGVRPPEVAYGDGKTTRPITPPAPVTPPPAPAPPEPAEEPEAKPVLLALALSGTRAAGNARLLLPPHAGHAVLQIDLEGESSFAAYSAQLVSASGALVWSAPRVVADAKADLLELHLATAGLSPGTFHLAIAGLEPRGNKAAPPQQLAVIPLEIVRAPLTR